MKSKPSNYNLLLDSFCGSIYYAFHVLIHKKHDSNPTFDVYWANKFFEIASLKAISLWRIFKADSILDFQYENGKMLFKNDSFHDFVSASILARALLENYLHLSYLINNDIDKEEKELRKLLWNRRMQNKSSTLAELYGYDRVDKGKLNKDIPMLDSKIESNKYFIQLVNSRTADKPLENINKLSTSKKIKLITNKDLWCYQTNEEILESVKINKKLFDRLYKLASDFAHTSPVALGLFAEHHKTATPKDLSKEFISYAQAGLMFTLRDLLKIDKNAEAIMNETPNAYNCIKISESIFLEK